MSKSEIALKHLYFDNWTDVDQPFAIYSRPYFFAHFDDVLNQVSIPKSNISIIRENERSYPEMLMVDFSRFCLGTLWCTVTKC